MVIGRALLCCAPWSNSTARYTNRVLHVVFTHHAPCGPAAQGGLRSQYVPPSTLLERVSIKLHNRRPEQLSPDVARQLQEWVATADSNILQVRPFGKHMGLRDLGYTNSTLGARGLRKIPGAAGVAGCQGSSVSLPFAPVQR